MEYDGVLMSRRADLLKRYLDEAVKLSKEIEKADIKALNVEGMQKCLDAREDLLSKIKETDGLLSRRKDADEELPEDALKYKWLCDKLVGQIVEAEEKNRVLFERMREKLEKSMQQNSDSIRGINAYFQLERQPESSQEWKK